MKGVEVIPNHIALVPWSIPGKCDATTEGKVVIRSERIMDDGTAQTLESAMPCKLPLAAESIADLQTMKDLIESETGWHVEITVVADTDRDGFAPWDEGYSPGLEKEER